MNRTIPCLIALLLAAVMSLHADPLNFSLTTAPLIGNSGGPFSLDFQFSDGSGTNDHNNTVTVGNFNFGSGGSAGVPIFTGGASGTVSSGLVLTDSSFFNDITLPFTPGATLGFSVTTTTHVDAGPTPDLFTLGILDQNGFNVPTTAGSFFDVFVEIPLNSATPPVMAFSSDTTRLLSTGGPTPNIAAPVVTTTAAVPEPAGVWLLGGCMGVLVLLRRRVTASSFADRTDPAGVRRGWPDR
ncbi:MAG TPA: NF038129 family PEP-CTERM protein [Bryobacteraceae bacterium]|jgi:hypothetical protein|nr:NF038129 family PEP-CTERM protein [Bryobacteraceae bacterium]